LFIGLTFHFLDDVFKLFEKCRDDNASRCPHKARGDRFA
jgi:hypothetical protein